MQQIIFWFKLNIFLNSYKYVVASFSKLKFKKWAKTATKRFLDFQRKAEKYHKVIKYVSSLF